MHVSSVNAYCCNNAKEAPGVTISNGNYVKNSNFLSFKGKFNVLLLK